MTPDVTSENEVPVCPKCSGDMWDNRASKRNPRAPDFKCKNRECDGVIWPPREGAAAGSAAAAGAVAGGGAARPTQGEASETPPCPVCGGRMWDDRATKRNPRAPDFKCRDKPKFQGGPGCPGVIWPPRDGERRPSATAAAPRTQAPRTARPASQPTQEPPPELLESRDFSDDELPF